METQDSLAGSFIGVGLVFGGKQGLWALLLSLLALDPPDPSPHLVVVPQRKGYAGSWIAINGQLRGSHDENVSATHRDTSEHAGDYVEDNHHERNHVSN